MMKEWAIETLQQHGVTLLLAMSPGAGEMSAHDAWLFLSGTRDERTAVMGKWLDMRGVET